jgi:hypothetical protein
VLVAAKESAFGKGSGKSSKLSVKDSLLEDSHKLNVVDMANTKFDSKKVPQAYCLRNCLELIGVVATKEQLLELWDKKTSKERKLCLASELEEKALRKVFKYEEKHYDVEMNKTKNKYSSTYIAVGSRLNIYKKCLLLKQGKPTASPSDQKLVDWNSVNVVGEAPDDNYTIDYFYDVVNGTQHAAGNVHVGNCAETNPNCSSEDGVQISTTQQYKTTDTTGGLGESSGDPPNNQEETTGQGAGTEATDSDISSDDDSDVGHHSPTPMSEAEDMCELNVGDEIIFY